MPAEPKVYLIRPAIVAPVLVIAAALYFGCLATPWALLAIPFAYLASVCAQPNLNMADGCLAWVSLFLGLVVLFFYPPAGLPILVGTMASYVLSVIEKLITARPLRPDPLPEGNPTDP